MSLQRGDFDATLERISKSLGNNTKRGLADQVDQFLGRPSKVAPEFKSKIPKYEAYFPFDAVDSLRKHSEGFSSPSIESERAMFLDFQDPNLSADEKTRAFDLILKSFIRLSIYKAQSYSGSSISFEEMVQESVFGIYRAAEKWDASLGNRFSTYASHWIDQAISRFLGDGSRTVRLPIHAHDQVRRTKAIARNDFLNGRPYRGIEKVASELETTPERLLQLLKADQMTTSLEQFAKKNDFASDEDADTLAQHVELVIDLNLALESLHPREAGVLRLRYGLNGDEPMALEAIGQIFDLTRERIRQIEKKALENLGEGFFGRNLRAHLGIDTENQTSEEPPRKPAKKARKTRRTPKDVPTPVEIAPPQEFFIALKPELGEGTRVASDDSLLTDWREIVRRTRLALLISRGNMSDEEEELCGWILELENAEIDKVLSSAGGIDALKSKLKVGATLFGTPGASLS